ncbi:uncharacterized protein LOC115631601 [Scaptodrosophila lebanonensis]|uniref:Uncharacterized protein LOC115631601 n=1 Tax=Drosophila lebanonensis TaxID=7225 RepID=A0A6J2U9U9_DROLE|nr:uncharacterized protein LOC115631601 [Scaptodrosophila lebanonensis]
MAAVLEDIENMEQLEAVSHLAQDIAAVADESEAQTIALNEETETLHHSEGEMESDSHSDSDSDIEDHHESAAIESIGVESPAAEAEAPQAAPQEPQKQKEREELESSDDEESGAGEHVEMSPTFNAEWETLAEDLANKNDAANDLSNHIDESFEHLAPIDLSHDIAVNDIAAANAQFPYNPDAELIDISNVQMLPKFEKLTLAIAPAVEQQQQPEEEELEMAETLLQ